MDTQNAKPDIILASFPRSGNTFLRNVLYEVYGIYSWNNIDVYNKSITRLDKLNLRKEKKVVLKNGQEKKWIELTSKFKYHVLKSHELPAKTLHLCNEKTKIIYLVRDGRDALVSMAHHRKDIVEPGTDFLGNLKFAIKAPMGSYFGGWSRNVEEWTKIADAVIRFEDFIKDPIKYTESFRSFMELPKPDRSSLPTFESQKTGSAHFGGNARNNYSQEEKDEFNSKFFRKGKVGTWKDEFPENLHDVFWKKNGETMKKMGYSIDGQILDLK